MEAQSCGGRPSKHHPLRQEAYLTRPHRSIPLVIDQLGRRRSTKSAARCSTACFNPCESRNPIPTTGPLAPIYYATSHVRKGATDSRQAVSFQRSAFESTPSWLGQGCGPHSSSSNSGEKYG